MTLICQVNSMNKKSLRIVIVGGVAAGASAATRARRCNEDAEIILLEKDEYVSFANCGLPYHIGGEIAERSRLLVATREMLQKRFRLDVRTRHEAMEIQRTSKTLRVRDRSSESEYDLAYDKLILCPGAFPLVPEIPGVSASGVMTLRNIADMDRIIAASCSSRTKQAIVIGAGFIGLEMVEQLVRIGFQVSLAEMLNQVLPPMDREMAIPLEEQLKQKGVTVCTGDGIHSVLAGDQNRAVGVELASGRQLAGDLVILGIGVRPATSLAIQAGLEIGKTGGILTNSWQQTSDPDIYAAGDACEYLYGPTGHLMRVPLAGPANRAGRLAGEHAATGRGQSAAPVSGTAIVRVFDQTAAMTGLSVKAAERLKKPARSVTIIAGQHAGYFPGATPVTLKLVYCPETGRILGAQCVGKDGVDKRIDIIATAMSFGGTVQQLANLDLCYAPPFGSAKDPVHQAAFVAGNEMAGFSEMLNADADLSQFQVVDVRTSEEVRKTPLAGCSHAINIPVDELRDRLQELQPDRPTVVSCGVGIRGHVALRILRQHGFPRVLNLTGGATLRNRILQGTRN